MADEKLPADIAYTPAIQMLLDTYGADGEHPMTRVLHEGLQGAPAARRRGGRRGRLGTGWPDA